MSWLLALPIAALYAPLVYAAVKDWKRDQRLPR